MKRRFCHIMILMLLGPFHGKSIAAQEYTSAGPFERIRIFTDRSLYIAGENICFSAALLWENSSSERDYSRVLYLEIIDQDNYSVLGQKYPVSDFLCTGIIPIPEELSTGIYYLKAYTKLMRNYGPGSYCYAQIKVVNPFKEEVRDENAGTVSRQPGPRFNPGYDQYNAFDIQMDKTVYQPLDPVLIRLLPQIQRDSIRSVCISVVPGHTSNPTSPEVRDAEPGRADFIFQPEPYGLSLTGIVVEQNSGLPMASAKLDLTILGENNDFISVYPDSSGRFLFPLPGFTGQRNIYIGTRETESARARIRIDNDFCTSPVIIASRLFMLTEQERIAALSLARNFQIYRRYNAGIADSAGIEEYRDPFYGEPTQTLDLDEYVQLPTLEDYFNELPYLVKVRRVDGRKSLKILGSSPELNIYPPLVLMDMVAVYDMEKILMIPSTDISHIDVINEPYVKGTMTYGGIVSIRSRNNDFAGIQLPRSGIFINYEFFSASAPDERIAKGDHSPDPRNTLFWQGDIQIRNGSGTEISFVAGNSRGHYDVVLQGIMKNGKTLSHTVSFVVE